MTKAQRIRLQRAIRRLGLLEDRAAKAQLRLLATVRRELLADIAGATGYRAWQLSQVLAAIDAYVAQGRAASEAAIASTSAQAATLGAEVATLSLAAGAAPSMAGVSQQLLAQLVDLGRDSLRDVWRELGSGLKRAIRRVVLGITDPYEAMGRVAKLIRDEKTFSSAFARAEAIVRTETNRVFSAANADVAQQSAAIVAKTGGRMVKWWLTAHDSRVRPAHVQAGEDYTREKAIPLEEPFMVDGEELMYPLDPNGSAANTINCYVSGTRVGGRVLAVSKAHYAGTVRRIETLRGHSLTVTPNHPILTGRGWIGADQLREGDDLLSNPSESQGALGLVDVHDQYAVPTVDEVFEALAADRRARLVVVTGLDFHGDARWFSDPNVHVVAVNGEILHGDHTGATDEREDLSLEAGVCVVRPTLSGESPALQLGGVIAPDAPDGSVGGGNLMPALRRSHGGPLQPFLVGLAAQFDTTLPEDPVDAKAADTPGRRNQAVVFRNAQDRLAGLVAPDQVVRVAIEPYVGPVFDVQTVGGWVHSNGIVSHNCRCVSLQAVVEG